MVLENFYSKKDPTYSQCIHPLIPISLFSAYTVILFIWLYHRLSKKALMDILSMLQLFLPKKNTLATSKDRFFKLLRFKSGMKKYHFCRSCKTSTGLTSKNCQKCHKKMDFLIYRNPLETFAERLRNKEFYELAQFRRLNRDVLQRKLRNTGRIEDVWDGKVYQEVADSFTSKPHHYTFIVNYDGATKWKSSLISAVPIYLLCHELPKSERLKVENMIFCGVWFGKEQPDTNLLFGLLVKDVLKGERDGFKAVDWRMNNIHVFARLLNSSADIPAQHDIMKVVHHGGTCSCMFCKHSGVKIGHRFSYPLLKCYEGKMFDHSLRTEEEILVAYQNMRQSYDMNPNRIPMWCGLRSIPNFELLPYWCFTNFSTVDIMHLMEGLFRTMMHVWIKPKYSKTGRALVQKREWLEWEDTYLLSQGIPEVFSRNLRSIYNNWKFFKASECMVFFLYSCKMLDKLLDLEYYRNLMLLSDVLYSIMKPGLTQAELNVIHNKVFKFIQGFQKLYGYDKVTMNVHLLLHLTHRYSLHGPPDCYSTFPFESFNKLLLSSIHGTYQVEQSLAEAAPLFQHLHLRLSGIRESFVLNALKKMNVSDCN